ncbi:MAG: SecD/SecF family protein translocase subunit [Oscillospiraceae bacterium]|nr:SecD/SecF family protein translocase subunit [Oscillospiraceae bacterium]
MKRAHKATFFIVLAVIVALVYTSIFGVSSMYGDKKNVYIKGGNDIRWGIDIRGGVDVTFGIPEDAKLSGSELEKALGSAEEVIKQRLVGQNIMDYEVYSDSVNNKIVVRFPWKEDDESFDPEAAIKELGETAVLGFYEGTSADEDGKPSGKKVLEGTQVDEASAQYNAKLGGWYVALKLTSDGATAFAKATAANVGKQISIWMDDTMISAPSVKDTITGGEAVITGDGSFTQEEVEKLARQINSGSLPFKLETSNFSTISPELGMGARDAMVMAGLIALVCIFVFMTLIYRLPGFVAGIALIGQAAGAIACVSGYFPDIPSFTLTLPGIAGIILSIGMGVDANVLTSTRIREELLDGKTLDGSIAIGFKRGFITVFDGNITMVICAVVLMAAFGPTSSLLSKLFWPLFGWFGATTAGTVYSFGYTLIVGVIFNFIMAVAASRWMLRSLAQFKVFRNPWFYGGKK